MKAATRIHRRTPPATRKPARTRRSAVQTGPTRRGVTLDELVKERWKTDPDYPIAAIQDDLDWLVANGYARVQMVRVRVAE